MNQVFLCGLVFVGVAAFGCRKSESGEPTGTTVVQGHEQGNGGDSPLPDHGAMWFVGEREVKVCFSRKDDFSISMAEARATFTEVVATWKDYFQSRVASRSGQLVFNDPTKSPSFNISYLDSCDETEDLKIYLGVTDDSVLTASKGFANPSAFSQKTAYDANAGWGRGFIWISKSGPEFEWNSKPHLLRAILLHEFGHVLGCPHLDDTIMSKDIVRVIHSGSVSDQVLSGYLTKIDHNKELVLNKELVQDIRGFSNLEACSLVSGQTCVSGDIDAQLKLQGRQNMILTVSDKVNASDLVIKLDGDEIGFDNSSTAFKLYKTGDVHVSYGVVAGAGSVQHGTGMTASGQTLDVIVARNAASMAGYGGIHISTRLAGRTTVLFQQFGYIY